MSANKTMSTDFPFRDFMNGDPDETKRGEGFALSTLMEKITGKLPVMWGPGIVGFAIFYYVYTTAREGHMPLTGFSSRKQKFTLNITSGFNSFDDLLKNLGNYLIDNHECTSNP